MRWILIVTLLFSSVAAAEPQLVAVLPLTTKVDVPLAGALNEAIRTAAGKVLAQSDYTVLTGDTQLRVLSDNGVDPNKVCDQDCALSKAKELKAVLFVSGSLIYAEGGYIANIRLYEGKVGKQLGAVDLYGKTVTGLCTQVSHKAPDLFQSIVLNSILPDLVPNKPVISKGKIAAVIGQIMIAAKPKGTRLELTDPAGKTFKEGTPYYNDRALPGHWKCTASAPGYEDETQEFDVLTDAALAENFHLNRLGGLKITGFVGASVMVTGPKGFNDEGGALPWEAHSLNPGTYRIQVARAGYTEVIQAVTVSPGETLIVPIVLIRQPIAFNTITPPDPPDTSAEPAPVPERVPPDGCSVNGVACPPLSPNPTYSYPVPSLSPNPTYSYPVPSPYTSTTEHTVGLAGVIAGSVLTAGGIVLGIISAVSLSNGKTTPNESIKSGVAFVNTTGTSALVVGLSGVAVLGTGTGLMIAF